MLATTRHTDEIRIDIRLIAIGRVVLRAEFPGKRATLLDIPRRRNVLKQQVDLGVPLADQFGMQTDGGENISAALRPLSVLRPRLRGRRDCNCGDTFALAFGNKPGRIAMQIDMAMKVKSPNGSHRLHGFTTTPFTLFPTSSMPRRKTEAYAAISASG